MYISFFHALHIECTRTPFPWLYFHGVCVCVCVCVCCVCVCVFHVSRTAKKKSGEQHAFSLRCPDDTH